MILLTHTCTPLGSHHRDSIKSQLKPSLGNALSTVVAIFTAQFPYWLVKQPAEMIKVTSQVNKFNAGVCVCVCVL